MGPPRKTVFGQDAGSNLIQPSPCRQLEEENNQTCPLISGRSLASRQGLLIRFEGGDQLYFIIRDGIESAADHHIEFCPAKS